MKEKFKETLEKIGKKQSDFSFEQDPIIEFLSIWVSKRKNIGRFVTSKEIFDELKDIGIQQEGVFLIKNHRSFAQKLGNIKSNLKEYFIFEERIEGGRLKKMAFWPLVEVVEVGQTEKSDENILF